MSPLLNVLQHLGEATLSTLWIPMAAWTVFALGVLALLRLGDRLDVLPQYAVRAALLLSLPVSLAFAQLTEFASFIDWAPVAAAAAYVPAVGAMEFSPVAESASPLLWTFRHSLGLLTLVAAGLALVRCGQLAYHSTRLVRSSRRIGGLPTPALRDLLESTRRAVGLRRPVRLAVTTLPVPPMTYGIVRPIVVLPESLLGQEDALRMTLLHELVHVRRHDVLLQWAERAVGAVFAVNPVVALLQRSVDYYREAACDAEVLRQPAVSGKRYASLLYSYSTQTARAPVLALPMTASPRTLKKRILAMTSRSNARFLTPRWIAVCVVLVLGSASVLVACTDNLNVEINVGERADAPSEADPSEAGPADVADATEETFVVVEEMPELIGGLASIQQAIRYPELARKAGIEGRVILQFVVNSKGRVEDPRVVRGVGSGLDEEALRAVREARFRPGRQRGRVVRVKMSLPVTFRLSEDTRANASFGTLRSAAADRRMRLVDLSRSDDAVRGRIVAGSTGDGISGASIVASGALAGAATDTDGYFTLKVPLDVQEFEIRRSGYDPLSLHVGPTVIK